MGAFKQQIDYTEYDAPGDFEIIPAGTYTAVVIEGDTKTAKSGSDYLKLTIKITDGPFAGRLVFDNFNLWHLNPQAKQIAGGKFRALCEAVGQPSPVSNTDVLLNKTFSMKIAVEEDKTGQYGPQNKVKGYKAFQNPRPSSHSAPTSQAASTSSSDDVPW